MNISAKKIRNEIEDSFKILLKIRGVKTEVSGLQKDYLKSLSTLLSLSKEDGEKTNEIHISHLYLLDELKLFWKQKSNQMESLSPEEKLIELKKELLKAKAVLESPDFKEKEHAWSNGLGDLLEDKTSWHHQRYGRPMLCEEKLVYSLLFDIHALECELIGNPWAPLFKHQT